MPNGLKLEAHSGFGILMDDPGHVSERNVGATPPNVYDLKPRQRLFHGVQALRMLPTAGNATLGRSGLLAHSYMLGANGDSNGCVSIKIMISF
jgi:Tlde1 domain